MDVCKMNIKEYFSYEYLEDLYNEYMHTVPYKCSGLFFQHETNKRGFMYIFPENRTNKKETTTSSDKPKLLKKNIIKIIKIKEKEKDSDEKEEDKDLDEKDFDHTFLESLDTSKSFNFYLKKTLLTNIY